MAFFLGKDREARRAYGFDEVAIVPGRATLDPLDTDITVKLGKIKMDIPFFASAMDGVVDANFAIKFGKLGGIAALNLDGIHSRYKDTAEAYSRIINAPTDKVTQTIQEVYREPVKPNLIGDKIREIKKSKVTVCVSTIPQNAENIGKLAQEAGADVLVVQGTVLSAKHISSKSKPLDLKKLCKDLKLSVVLGNCVSYKAALDLMETGCVGILVGIGPGSACTSRGVLGIGVPQITATIDCAAARDYHYKKTGNYVNIITDGGMNTGGDICKAFVAGADSVMFGNAFVRAQESPGKGYHWGMAMPHRYLPRGTRIFVGTTGTLEEILFGPAKTDDGTQNFVDALRTCMGTVGASNIKELQLAELIIAPDIKSEGKLFQKAQKVGMCK